MAAAQKFMDPKTRPLALGASLATADIRRGPLAKHECGTRVWRRTVVVYVRLQAFPPSQSRSQAVLLVGRFRGGFRVWQVTH